MGPAVDDRIQSFKGFLTALWREQDTKWRYVSSSATYTAVQGVFPPIDEKALEAAIPSDSQRKGDSSFGHRFLYLPPLENEPELVPVMSFHYDFTEKDRNSMKLSLHLLTLYDGAIHALGYRFETPHGSGKKEAGVHDFHHVQICREYMGGGNQWKHLPNCPPWLPTSQPSFPIPASDYVELLVCLLVSLYGGHWTKPLQPTGIHAFEKYAKFPH